MFTKEVRRGGGGGPRRLITLCILVQSSDGGSYGGILRGVIPRFLGGDPGGPPIPNNLQCGGGRSGTSLDLVGGRRRGREGRVGKGGDAPRHHFLRGLWPGHINGAGLVAGIV